MTSFDVYEYRMIEVSLEPFQETEEGELRKATIESAANRWAGQGWRTVGVVPARGPGQTDRILIEKKKFPNAGLLAIKYRDEKDKTYYLPPDRVELIYQPNEV